MQAALDYLSDGGMAINPEDMAWLSPLQHQHINVLGRYSFALAAPIVQGELRPLNLEVGNCDPLAQLFVPLVVMVL